MYGGMLNRACRPEGPESKQLSCLPRAQPYPSTQLTGHFDAVDLTRRLEAHQTQCREARKVYQRQKQKDAKEVQDEQGKNGKVPLERADSRSKQKEQRPHHKRKNIVATNSATNPHAMIQNLAFVPEAQGALLTRHEETKRASSVGQATFHHSSPDQFCDFRGQSFAQTTNQQHTSPQGGSTYREQNVEYRSMTGLATPAQQFKIYTHDNPAGSRPRAVAMNVQEKGKRESRVTMTDCSHLPQHAASDMAKTTAQRIGRGKLSKRLSQLVLSSNRGNKESLILSPTKSNETTMLETIEAVKETLVSVPKTKDTKRNMGNPKPGADLDTRKPIEDIRSVEVEDAADETSQPLMGSYDGEEPLASTARSAPHTPQPPTLKAKISSMRLLGRRPKGETVVQVPGDAITKPSISRRRSMLLIFRLS